MAARLTPDQKVGSSNLSALILSYHNVISCLNSIDVDTYVAVHRSCAQRAIQHESRDTNGHTGD